jgi:beta-lactamase regulating signal transducer with metallopeptidase domain
MTTAFLIELAWKSTLTLGATLAILQLLKHRSAAERSWLAHAGLLVTLLLPLVLLTAPRWQVEAPAPVAGILASAPVEAPVATSANSTVVSTSDDRAIAPVTATIVTQETMGLAELPTAWLIYAAPAALLMTLTVVAIFRLFGLRRRANVLVDNSWLSALAQAQRRMGFKHGTALLVSNDIHSPVSWGVLRPVILLNEAAIGSKEQAEAIIAHELAHVARLDWAKLLLARVAAAIFWFNPLVWVLAKACHQLREEAADDAVLASDVPDLDYAELLVGVARHESGALLLAANGVAPSRGSLARRVARVLDTSRRRAPARLGWATACTLGASLFAAPLAALSLAEPMPLKPVRLALAPMPVSTVRPAPAAPAAPVAPQAPVSPSDPAPMEVAAAAPAPALVPVVQAVAAPQPIELPPFSSISLHGGGRVILRHGTTQKVRILGGDPMTANFAVAGNSLAISGCATHDCPKELVVELTVPKVDAIAIRGGGTVHAQGSFPAMRDLALAIMGGGEVDVRAIPVTEVAAAVRGGGLIQTAPTRELAASVSGGGAIRYWGDPEVATSINGGGSVERGK